MEGWRRGSRSSVRAMTKSNAKRPEHVFATHEDIARLLGRLDDKDVVDILALTPTVVEVEEASAWLDGSENKAARRGHPQTSRVVAILDIVDPDDEEPRHLR